MPVIVRRGAKTQPLRIRRKLSNVGKVITTASGCSTSRNEGTRDIASFLVRWSRCGNQTPLCRKLALLGRAVIPISKSAKVELSRSVLIADLRGDRNE